IAADFLAAAHAAICAPLAPHISILPFLGTCRSDCRSIISKHLAHLSGFARGCHNRHTDCSFRGPRPWTDKGPGGEGVGRIFIRMRKSAPYTLRSLSRRQFLQVSGMAALYAHLPAGWVGRVFASDAPETPQLRIGIIALTDCSSIVIAYEKGFFQEQGLDVTISKEASWA